MIGRRVPYTTIATPLPQDISISQPHRESNSSRSVVHIHALPRYRHHFPQLSFVFRQQYNLVHLHTSIMSLAIQELQRSLEKHWAHQQASLINHPPKPHLPPIPEEEVDSIYVCVLLPRTTDGHSSRRPSVSLDDATIMTMPLSKGHRTGMDHFHNLRRQMLQSWQGDREGMLCYSFLVDI